MLGIKRREFITLLGGVAAWPLAARAQRSVPVIGVINGGTLNTTTSSRLSAFRAGLATTGYVEGQNVSVEYHWLEGHFDRIPAVVADLVQRRVAVIATPAAVAAARAAKAATTTIPIVFGVNDDPIRLGLVTSFARPGGNLTGMNFFSQEAVPKRLGLFHELILKANRVAVLINPSNEAASETTVRDAQEAGRAIGLSIEILRASTSGEIEAAFQKMVSERIEALFIAGDSYFTARFQRPVQPSSRKASDCRAHRRWRYANPTGNLTGRYATNELQPNFAHLAHGRSLCWHSVPSFGRAKGTDLSRPAEAPTRGRVIPE